MFAKPNQISADFGNPLREFASARAGITDKDVDDASHVPTLLDQLTQAPASFMADGAHDRVARYDAILARNPSVRFIVPPCKADPMGASSDRGLGIFAVCCSNRRDPTCDRLEIRRFRPPLSITIAR